VNFVGVYVCLLEHRLHRTKLSTSSCLALNYWYFANNETLISYIKYSVDRYVLANRSSSDSKLKRIKLESNFCFFFRLFLCARLQYVRCTRIKLIYLMQRIPQLRRYCPCMNSWQLGNSVTRSYKDMNCFYHSKTSSKKRNSVTNIFHAIASTTDFSLCCKYNLLTYFRAELSLLEKFTCIVVAKAR